MKISQNFTNLQKYYYLFFFILYFFIIYLNIIHKFFGYNFASTSEIITIDLYKTNLTYMAEQNKLVKTVTDSAVLVGLTAGVGFYSEEDVERKLLRRPILKHHELC